MSELKGIISTKGNLKSTINSKVKTNGTVSVGGTLITSNLSKKGDDGFSPIATVTKVGDTATITITDKNGTTTAQIHDGSGGGGASAFVAEYNVTSYSDTKDAYDDDAIIICTADDSGNTAIYQLAYFDSANEIFYFTLDASDGCWYTSLSSADGWDSSAWNYASTDTATQLRDGLMSALDKQKLDGIASGAEVNVQSNWSQSDNTKDDYIKNKPTIPTKVSDLNNDSGFISTETDPVFTASDAYGITASDISDWNDKSEVSLSQILSSGTNIADITIDGTTTSLYAPAGGSAKNVWYGTCSTSASSSPKSITTTSGDFSLTTGSILCVLFAHANSLSGVSLEVDGNTAKSAYPMDGVSDISNRWGSNEVVMFAYDGTKFILLEQGMASTTAYGITKLNNTVTSTSTSESATAKAVKTAYDLANGKADAVHTHTVSDVTDFPSLATVATTGDYDDLTDKPTIPTDTLDLTNGAGYITGYTETDPVFTASAAYGISSTDISNWNGKSDFSGSYNDLTDKPTIPTVNNATLTIQKNGTTVNTFTANASSNVTANITVHDVPSGGSANQVLAKNSGTDYDLKWTSAGGGGGTLVQLVRW